MDDPYDLERFVRAQRDDYELALSEIVTGRKRSHWMWYIFPQIAGLGHSQMTKKFSLSSLAEAQAYIKHPLLGPRLRECTRLVNQVEGRSIQQIFGYPDDLKFRSSMTLFAQATPDNALFQEALQKYFNGELDSQTVERL